MLNTPILFLVFNRPDQSKKVFDRIRLIKPKYLFVAADGPRLYKEGEEEKCTLVRQILTSVDWECEVKTLFREKNLGCGRAVSEAISWFFENVEEGIILEDDTLPNVDFFHFCEKMLDLYRFNSNVWSISGCNLGYELESKHSYGFSRFMNMWGWATWKRSALLVDYNMKSWAKFDNKEDLLKDKLKSHFLDNDKEWFRYWINTFDSTYKGKVDTWDYQWIYAQILNKMYSIFPKVNLVKNLGFDSDATHTSYPGHYLSRLEYFSLDSSYNHPKKIKVDLKHEKLFIKAIWCSHIRTSFFKEFRTKFKRRVLRIIK